MTKYYKSVQVLQYLHFPKEKTLRGSKAVISAAGQGTRSNAKRLRFILTARKESISLELGPLIGSCFIPWPQIDTYETLVILY